MRLQIAILSLAALLTTVQCANADRAKKKRAPAAALKSVTELIAEVETSDSKQDAAILLGLLGPKAKDAAPFLRKVMKNSGNRFLRLHAAWAIVRIDRSHAKEAVGVLIDSLAEEKDVAGYAVLLLATLGESVRDALPILKKIAAAEDEDELTRLEARAALRHIESGRMEGAVAVMGQAWQKSCRKADLDEAEGIADDLIFFALMSSEARQILCQALKHPNPHVRELVADELGDIIGPALEEVVPALETALSDSNKTVAIRAAASLLWIGGGESPKATESLGKAIASFRKALDDRDNKTRKETLVTLKSLAMNGIQVQTLIPLLRQMAQKDSSVAIRKTARSVLWEMEEYELPVNTPDPPSLPEAATAKKDPLPRRSAREPANAGIAASRSDTAEGKLRASAGELLSKYQNVLVTVKLTVADRSMMKAMLKDAPARLAIPVSLSSINYKVEATGTVVSADGLVVISTSMLESLGLGGFTLPAPGFEGKIKNDREIKEIKILFHDGREVLGRFLGNDKRNNLTFLKPAKELSNLSHLALDRVNQARVLDDVLVLYPLSKALKRRIAVRHCQIAASGDTSGNPPVLADAVYTLAGCPAFDAGGRPIGIVTTAAPLRIPQTIGDQFEAMSNEGRLELVILTDEQIRTAVKRLGKK